MALSLRTIELIEQAHTTVECLARYYGTGRETNSSDSLCGYCGISSRFLIKLLQRNGIRGAKLVCGAFDQYTHCWVELDDFCIDLTISQFKGQENKKYRICKTTDVFYQLYEIDLKGARAEKYQSRWLNGQDYGSNSSRLWDIYRQLYEQR